MEKVDEAKIRLAVLKENFEYQNFYDQFMQWIKKIPEGVWPGLGFNKFGLLGLRYLLPSPAYKQEDLYKLISPWLEIEPFPEKILKSILPRLFYDPAVKMIELKGKRNFDFEEVRYVTPMWVVEEKGLKSSERIYLVDLSKKKSEIMEEFEEYINRALSKGAKKDWIPYNKRNRQETWTHLKVWKLRRQKKNFSEIAQMLGITIDATKKSFYRAYELTQQKRYDPIVLKKEIWLIKKPSLKKTCATCPDKKTCDTLCPDVLRYVDQDIIMLREKHLSEDSDSYRDFLMQPKKGKRKTRYSARD